MSPTDRNVRCIFDTIKGKATETDNEEFHRKRTEKEEEEEEESFPTTPRKVTKSIIRHKTHRQADTRTQSPCSNIH